MGINNSIEGVFGSYSYENILTLKGLYGRPRLYTDYTDSWVRGADLSFSVANLIGWQGIMLNLEGSYVNRNEKVSDELAELICPYSQTPGSRTRHDYLPSFGRWMLEIPRVCRLARL